MVEPTSSVRPKFKSAPGRGDQVAKIGTPVLAGEFLSPVMVLKERAIEHNIATMAGFCQSAGVAYAPHVKTTMSRELVARQLAAGAWGVSVATPAQVRTLRSFGVQNVLLANELVDPGGIEWIARDLSANPEHGFLCYVDSIAGVDLLEAALPRIDIQLTVQVMIEVSAAGGRTGCRTLAEARRVAQRLSGATHLQLVGVAGYEGCLGGDRSPETVAKVVAFCGFLGEVATALDEDGLLTGDTAILSAGGGAFFDLVVDTLAGWESRTRESRLLIRPGSYITHDDGLYAEIAAFAQPGSSWTLQPALEIWGRVLSRPEEGLAFLDFGRRDVPFDQGLPTPHTVRGLDGSIARPAETFRITTLNDQHAYLRLPADDPLAIGDWVGCGVSHPCTAFDKWHYLPLVDDNYRCVGAVTTVF